MCWSLMVSAGYQSLPCNSCSGLACGENYGLYERLGSSIAERADGDRGNTELEETETGTEAGSHSG